jgi:hypothetical protein
MEKSHFLIDFSSSRSHLYARVFNTYGSGHAWPFAVIEGFPCRPHGQVDVLRVAFSDAGYDVPCTRIPGLERPSCGRKDEGKKNTSTE